MENLHLQSQFTLIWYIYVEFASLVDCCALIIKSGKKVDGFLPDKIVIKWVSVDHVGNLVLKH